MDECHLHGEIDTGTLQQKKDYVAWVQREGHSNSHLHLYVCASKFEEG